NPMVEADSLVIPVHGTGCVRKKLPPIVLKQPAVVERILAEVIDAPAVQYTTAKVHVPCQSRVASRWRSHAGNLVPLAPVKHPGVAHGNLRSHHAAEQYYPAVGFVVRHAMSTAWCWCS